MTGAARGMASHRRRQPGRIGAVVAIALAGATIDGAATASRAGPTRDAAPADGTVTTTGLRRLDLNSFPDSTRPRRHPALHMPSDDGLVRIERVDDDWALADEPGDSRLMSVFVPDGRARARSICFTGTGGKGATDRAIQALRVSLDPGGRREAMPIDDRPGCANHAPSGVASSPPPMAGPQRVDAREARRLVRAAAAARRAAGSAPRVRPDVIRLGAEDDRSFTYSVHAADGCPPGEPVCSTLIGHFRVDKATGTVTDADREPD